VGERKQGRVPSGDRPLVFHFRGALEGGPSNELAVAFQPAAIVGRPPAPITASAVSDRAFAQRCAGPFGEWEGDIGESVPQVNMSGRRVSA